MLYSTFNHKLLIFHSKSAIHKSNFCNCCKFAAIFHSTISPKRAYYNCDLIRLTGTKNICKQIPYHLVNTSNKKHSTKTAECFIFVITLPTQCLKGPNSRSSKLRQGSLLLYCAYRKSQHQIRPLLPIRNKKHISPLFLLLPFGNNKIISKIFFE